MKTTKNAPTRERRSTTAVPPPNAASVRMPMADPIGIATVSATIARMRRSSLTASRRSRWATMPALRRSRFSKLTWVIPNDREIDVLQRRQLAHLHARLQPRAAPQLGEVADRQRAPGGHDADGAPAGGQALSLVHAVSADHQRAAAVLQVLQVGP